jgi:hypothetical protein
MLEDQGKFRQINNQISQLQKNISNQINTQTQTISDRMDNELKQIKKHTYKIEKKMNERFE